MTLEEKNLLYTVKEESLSKPSPELLQRHPEGKVPLLIHGDLVIYESAIIMEYLEDSFPEISLFPQSPEDRARVRLWGYWCNAIFKPDLDLYKYKWEKITKEERETLSNRLSNHLQKIENSLIGNTFLCGQNFSLADIFIFPFYRQLRKARPDFLENFVFARLEEWFQRIEKRSAFERAMKN